MLFIIKFIIFIIIITLFIMIKIKRSQNVEKLKKNLSNNKKSNENIVFFIKNKPVFLEEIENDFYDLFYKAEQDDKIHKLVKENSSEDVIVFYKNQNKMIQFSKGRNNNIENIIIFYQNKKLMYKFKLLDNIKVELEKYTDLGEQVYRKGFNIKELGILLDKYSIDGHFFYTIVLLYRILGIRKLMKLINYNNFGKQSAKEKKKDAEGKDKVLKNLVFTLKEIDEKKDFQNPDSIKEHSDGPFRVYFDNQMLKSIGSYKNNQFHGKFTGYYPNGRIKEEGYYEEGVKVHKWRYYNENGLLTKEEKF
ncbi:toxin-antitoxin system YwqK family antitoxin [Fusobacterium sp. PH5-44]|uniref:toxin-antitoxin system YwqK family antitoxin n=1 Tax=unclassified Fusobacterium TaxID=2648384 RepID=UPI003D2397B1